MCKSDETVLIQIKPFFSSVWLMLACLAGASNSAASNEVTYCVDPNWLPYEAIESNQHIGLSADYIQLLQANTGHDFKLVRTKDWQQSLEFIKSGDCMLLPMLNQTPESGGKTINPLNFQP